MVKPGDRVQLHPATDWWMRGARYGVVHSVNVRRETCQVRLDVTRRLVTLSFRNIGEVV